MNQSETIIKKWIANREFLDEIGKLYEAVWEICLPFEDDAVDIPNWAVYQEAFSKGTPILAHEKFQLPLQKRAACVFQALTNLADNEKIPSVSRRTGSQGVGTSHCLPKSAWPPTSIPCTR